ncbi:hypothetical protein DXG03_002568 [Asterophora parasitica]|uniref:Uncharacterized protein n=1 Tax=Asterophora parasitica TaxID=117018 RepID=A0A9P7KB50_9AGAR|nr:hypothetical protein DXG03_002568 [Asterophora parasitica]
MHTPSVAASSRSRKSSRHAKSRKESSETKPDKLEKLVVKTVDLPKDPYLKTGSPRPEYPGETLAVVVGESSRRSRCTPEFLQLASKRNLNDTFEDLGKKFTIVTGSEAVTFYKSFLGGKSAAEIVATKENTTADGEEPPSVVFGVAVTDARRRHVDYYTTWRSRTCAKDLTGRRLKYLDSQFRKAARALDNEAKATAAQRLPLFVAASTRSEKNEPDEPTTKSRPTSIIAPPPQLKLDAIRPPLYDPISKIKLFQVLTLSSSSATDSVVSLPYLDMVRNVPLTHRIPLRVTNPDRLSLISSSDAAASPTTEVQSPPATALAPIAESDEVIDTAAPTPRPTNSFLGPNDAMTRRNSIRSSHSKESSAASTISGGSHRSKKRDWEMPTFLIILLDDMIEQDTRTWHGLERQLSTNTPSNSARVSLWDGPLARDNGIKYSTPRSSRRSSRRSSPQQEEQESFSEDEESKHHIIPAVIPSAFQMTRSVSQRSFRPFIPPGAFASQTAGMAPTPTPMMVPMVALSSSSRHSAYGPIGPIPHVSPYPISPYVPLYPSPYSSPVIPDIRPLSRGIYPPFGYP